MKDKLNKIAYNNILKKTCRHFERWDMTGKTAGGGGENKKKGNEENRWEERKMEGEGHVKENWIFEMNEVETKNERKHLKWECGYGGESFWRRVRGNGDESDAWVKMQTKQQKIEDKEDCKERMEKIIG